MGDSVLRTLTGLVLVSAAFVTSGCFNGDTSYSEVKAPSDIPKISVDEAASELVATNTVDATDLAPLAKEAIEATVANDTKQAVPVRYKLRVEGSAGWNGANMAYCFIPLSFVLGVGLACRFRRITAHAELVLDTGHERFVGSGVGIRNHNGNGSGKEENDVLVWRAAVYAAVQDAIANIKRENKAVVATREGGK